MTTRVCLPPAAGVLLTAVALACGGSDAPTESSSHPQTGALEVSVSTSGEEIDSDGYQVVVRDTIKRELAVNGSVRVDGLPAGSYEVEVRKVVPNCWFEGSEPRSVRVSAGNTATVSFSVQCEKQRIVFSSESWEDGNKDIGLIRPDGRGLVRLTSSPESDRDPTLSPNLSQVVFERRNEGLFLVSSDGSSPRSLTPSSVSLVREPEWGPQGDKIFFLCVLNYTKEGICSISPSGENLKMVVLLTEALSCEESPCGFELAVSPQGDRFLVYHSDLYLVDTDGNVERLTSYDRFTVGQPDWSPNGNRIFFLVTVPTKITHRFIV